MSLSSIPTTLRTLSSSPPVSSTSFIAPSSLGQGSAAAAAALLAAAKEDERDAEAVLQAAAARSARSQRTSTRKARIPGGSRNKAELEVIFRVRPMVVRDLAEFHGFKRKKPSKAERERLAESARQGFGGKPSAAIGTDDPSVVHMEACPLLSCLFVLCNRKVATYRLSDGKHVETLAPKGVTAFAHRTIGQEALLAIAVRRRLYVFRFGFTGPKRSVWRRVGELFIPERVHKLQWMTQSRLCVGFRREYTIVHTTRGNVQDLAALPFGASPLMGSLGGRMFLVSTGAEGAVHVIQPASASRLPPLYSLVNWHTPPLGMVIKMPFIVCIFMDRLCVYHVSGPLLRTIEAEGRAFARDLSGVNVGLVASGGPAGAAAALHISLDHPALIRSASNFSSSQPAGNPVQIVSQQPTVLATSPFTSAASSLDSQAAIPTDSGSIMRESESAVPATCTEAPTDAFEEPGKSASWVQTHSISKPTSICKGSGGNPFIFVSRRSQIYFLQPIHLSLYGNDMEWLRTLRKLLELRATDASLEIKEEEPESLPESDEILFVRDLLNDPIKLEEFIRTHLASILSSSDHPLGLMLLRFSAFFRDRYRSVVTNVVFGRAMSSRSLLRDGRDNASDGRIGAMFQDAVDLVTHMQQRMTGMFISQWRVLDELDLLPLCEDVAQKQLFRLIFDSVFTLTTIKMRAEDSRFSDAALFLRDVYPNDFGSGLFKNFVWEENAVATVGHSAESKGSEHDSTDHGSKPDDVEASPTAAGDAGSASRLDESARKAKCAAFARFLKPFDHPIQMINQLNDIHWPTGKLKLLSRIQDAVCSAAEQVWQLRHPGDRWLMSADELIPVLCYCFVQAEVRAQDEGHRGLRPFSQMHFMLEFMAEEQKQGQEGYAVTSIQVALGHVVRLNSQSNDHVSMDDSLVEDGKVDDGKGGGGGNDDGGGDLPYAMDTTWQTGTDSLGSHHQILLGTHLTQEIQIRDDYWNQRQLNQS